MVNEVDIIIDPTYDVLDFTVSAGETLNLNAHATVLYEDENGNGTGIKMSLTKTDSSVTDMEVAASNDIVTTSKSKNPESNIIYRALVTE